MNKGAYLRGIVLNPDKVFRTPEEVAALIKSHLNTTTEKYDFLDIFVMEPFEREKNPGFIEVKGIMQYHSFTRTPDGKIIARKLSCSDCIKLDKVCDFCSENARVIYEPPVSLEESTPMEEGGAEDEDEEDFVEHDEDGEHSDDDDGSCLSDGCGGDPELDFEEDEEPEEDPIGPGTVVWVRRREWYPGRVVDLHDLPQGSRKYLPEHPEREFIVQLFPPFNEVCLAKRHRVAILDENKEDKAKASRSAAVNQSYNYALSVLRGDI